MTIHAIRNPGARIVDMPPSSYRPSPPSVRPPVPLQADKTFPLSVLDELGPAEVAKKKKGGIPKNGTRSPESIAKQKATLAAKRAAAQRATKKAEKSEKTLVSTRAAASKPKNEAPIVLTGVREWLRGELEAMKPELRLIVRDELRKMLGGA